MSHSQLPTIHEDHLCKQITPVLILSVATVLALHFCIIGHGFYDWADAIDYHGVSKIFATTGKFATFFHYEHLSQIDSSIIVTNPINYPNYGFQLAIIAISSLRNEFDPISGIIASCIFSFLFIFTAYYCALRIVKSPTLAIIFSLLLLIHPSILEIIARPLPDMGLLFFFAAATMATLNNKFFFSGLTLGAGYFYREHALMFLPFMPILSPKCISIKTYLSILVKHSIGFLPLFTARYAISETYDKAGKNLYYDAYTDWFLQWFTLDAFKSFIFNIYAYAKRFGWHVCIFIASCVIAWKKVPLPILRHIFVGSCISLIPCFMWTVGNSVPIRYQVYSLFLFYLAIMYAISLIKEKKIQLLVAFSLIIVSFSIRQPTAINFESMNALLQPYKTYEKFYEYVSSPNMFGKIVPVNGHVLADNIAIPLMTLSQPSIFLAWAT